MDTPVLLKKLQGKQVPTQSLEELTNRQRLLQYEEKMDKSTVELSLEPEQPEKLSYLVNILYDVGPILSGAMDLRSLQYSDLQAWISVCGIQLEGWEARLILRFSNIYLDQYQKAREGGPVPQLDPTSDENRRSVASKIISILDSRVKSTRRKKVKR